MSIFRDILISVRYAQWIKNFFVFLPLIFSLHLFNDTYILRSALGFLSFSLLSSGIYLLNDLFDIEKDKKHPIKRERPIAQGRLSVSMVVLLSILLILCAIGSSYYLSYDFFLIIIFYLSLQVLYSWIFKEVVIIDVMIVAFGFVLRVISGALIIDVSFSFWMILCTSMLALFLGFAKRKSELFTMEREYSFGHRDVLLKYNHPFLDQMISVATATTVLSYSLYTVADQTVAKFGSTKLITTVPFVIYGVFRYLYIVHKRHEGENPTEVILKDGAMQINLFLWFITACFLIYWR